MKVIFIIFFFYGLNAQGYGLADCIDIAIGAKKTLQSSELGVFSAQEGIKGSYSGFLPSLSASTSTGRTHSPRSESITPNFESFSFDTTASSYFDNMSAVISLNQALFNGGRSLNQVKQAKSQLHIAKLNHRSIKIQVIQNVIQSYYGLLKAQELHDVAVKNLEVSEQQVSLVQKQFDLGVVKRTDLLKAEVAQGQAKVEALSRQTNLDNARRVLFNDMGLQDFGQPITAREDKWSPPVIPPSSEILELLKTSNPNLLISHEQVYLGEISYEMVKGMRMPSINSSVSYSANGENSNELKDAIKDNWSLGMNLSVSVPIFTGNSLSVQQHQAKLSKQQSEYNYVTLLNDLRVQAELIRKTLENYTEIIPINRAVVISAEEDLKLVRERYSLGSATILEVLDAQVSLIRSNSTLINTIHDARIQEASLKALLGTLDLEFQTKED